MAQNEEAILFGAAVLLVIALLAGFAGQQVTRLLAGIGLGGFAGEIGALVAIIAFVVIVLAVLDRL